jgi:hypothetical protein
VSTAYATARANVYPAWLEDDFAAGMRWTQQMKRDGCKAIIMVRPPAPPPAHCPLPSIIMPSDGERDFQQSLPAHTKPEKLEILPPKTHLNQLPKKPRRAQLTHIGYDADLYAAKLWPDADLIIGGHSHTFLGYNTPYFGTDKWGGKQYETVSGAYPSWVDVGGGKKTPVVSVGWGGRHIGNMYLDFNSNGDLVGFQGWPQLLGGGDSGAPMPMDGWMTSEVYKWKYW